MASKVDQLLHNYELVVNEPWTGRLSLSERMMFLVYDPGEQRKVDFRINDFESATLKAGRKWQAFSMKPLFPEWMSGNEYRDAYFQDTDMLIDQLDGDFKEFVVKKLEDVLNSMGDDDQMVLAIRDVASLFGLGRLSEVLGALQTDFRGRVLVFFPGEFDKNQYRLLDARDGWSYLARPITV